jgi:hypothetical protein
MRQFFPFNGGGRRRPWGGVRPAGGSTCSISALGGRRPAGSIEPKGHVGWLAAELIGPKARENSFQK